MTTLTLKNEHGEDFCRIDTSDIDWYNDETRQFAIQNPDQIVVLETYEETLRREGIGITHKETGEPIGSAWLSFATWLKFPPRRKLTLQISSVNQESHPLWPTTRLLYQTWIQQINTDASDQMIGAIWEAFITMDEAVHYETGYFPFSIAMQMLCEFRTVLFSRTLAWTEAQQCVNSMRRNLLSGNWKQTERRQTIPQTNSTRILRGWENTSNPEEFVSVQEVLALRHLAHMACERHLIVSIHPA